MSTKERIGLLPETLVGLPRMKEYARHKGDLIVLLLPRTCWEEWRRLKGKNYERILEEHKGEEEVRQNLKEDAD